MMLGAQPCTVQHADWSKAADLAIEQGSRHKLEVTGHDHQPFHCLLQLLQAALHNLHQPVEALHLLAQHHRQGVELASRSPLEDARPSLCQIEQGWKLVQDRGCQDGDLTSHHPLSITIIINMSLLPSIKYAVLGLTVCVAVKVTNATWVIMTCQPKGVWLNSASTKICYLGLVSQHISTG